MFSDLNRRRSRRVAERSANSSAAARSPTPRPRRKAASKKEEKDGDDGEEYEIGRVLGSTVENGIVYYYITYKGYEDAPEHDRWIPESEMPLDTIEEFDALAEDEQLAREEEYEERTEEAEVYERHEQQDEDYMPEAIHVETKEEEEKKEKETPPGRLRRRLLRTGAGAAAVGEEEYVRLAVGLDADAALDVRDALWKLSELIKTHKKESERKAADGEERETPFKRGRMYIPGIKIAERVEKKEPLRVLPSLFIQPFSVSWSLLTRPGTAEWRAIQRALLRVPTRYDVSGHWIPRMQTSEKKVHYFQPSFRDILKHKGDLSRAGVIPAIPAEDADATFIFLDTEILGHNVRSISYLRELCAVSLDGSYVFHVKFSYGPLRREWETVGTQFNVPRDDGRSNAGEWTATHKAPVTLLEGLLQFFESLPTNSVLVAYDGGNHIDETWITTCLITALYDVEDATARASSVERYSQAIHGKKIRFTTAASHAVRWFLLRTGIVLERSSGDLETLYRSLFILPMMMKKKLDATPEKQEAKKKKKMNRKKKGDATVTWTTLDRTNALEKSSVSDSESGAVSDSSSEARLTGTTAAPMEPHTMYADDAATKINLNKENGFWSFSEGIAKTKKRDGKDDEQEEDKQDTTGRLLVTHGPWKDLNTIASSVKFHEAPHDTLALRSIFVGFMMLLDMMPVVIDHVVAESKENADENDDPFEKTEDLAIRRVDMEAKHAEDEKKENTLDPVDEEKSVEAWNRIAEQEARAYNHVVRFVQADIMGWIKKQRGNGFIQSKHLNHKALLWFLLKDGLRSVLQIDEAILQRRHHLVKLPKPHDEEEKNRTWEEDWHTQVIKYNSKTKQANPDATVIHESQDTYIKRLSVSVIKPAVSRDLMKHGGKVITHNTVQTGEAARASVWLHSLFGAIVSRHVLTDQGTLNDTGHAYATLLGLRVPSPNVTTSSFVELLSCYPVFYLESKSVLHAKYCNTIFWAEEYLDLEEKQIHKVRVLKRDSSEVKMLIPGSSTGGFTFCQDCRLYDVERDPYMPPMMEHYMRSKKSLYKTTGYQWVKRRKKVLGAELERKWRASVVVVTPEQEKKEVNFDFVDQQQPAGNSDTIPINETVFSLRSMDTIALFAVLQSWLLLK